MPKQKSLAYSGAASNGNRRFGKSGRKPLQLSEVWNHYVMSSEGLSVDCKYCGRNMKRTDSSTKSMWGHLFSFHKKEVGQATFDRKRKRCVKPKLLPDGTLPEPKKKNKNSKRGKSKQQNNCGANFSADLSTQYFKDATLVNMIASSPCFSSLALNSVPTTANIFDLLNGGMAEHISDSASPSTTGDEKPLGRMTKSGSETCLSASKEDIDPTIAAEQYAFFENIVNLASSGVKTEKHDDFLSLAKSVQIPAEDANAQLAVHAALLATLGPSGDALTHLPAHVLDAACQLFAGGYLQQMMESLVAAENGLSVDYAPKIDVENQYEKVGDFLKKQLQSGQNKQLLTASSSSTSVNQNSFSAALIALQESACQSRSQPVIHPIDDLIRRAGNMYVDDVDAEESPRCLASSSSASPVPVQPAVSLQSPEGLSAMHQIALDLNLIYIMRRRDDGTPQFEFRSNNSEDAKNSGRYVTLTETADKINISMYADTFTAGGSVLAGLPETDEWPKSNADQLMWAVRGICQKCFSASN